MEWSHTIHCNIIATNHTIERYNSYVKYQLVFKQTKGTESILEDVSVTPTSWDCNKINLHASIVRFFIAPTSRHTKWNLTVGFLGGEIAARAPRIRSDSIKTVSHFFDRELMAEYQAYQRGFFDIYLMISLFIICLAFYIVRLNILHPFGDGIYCTYFCQS